MVKRKGGAMKEFNKARFKEYIAQKEDFQQRFNDACDSAMSSEPLVNLYKEAIGGLEEALKQIHPYGKMRKETEDLVNLKQMIELNLQMFLTDDEVKETIKEAHQEHVDSLLDKETFPLNEGFFDMCKAGLKKYHSESNADKIQALQNYIEAQKNDGGLLNEQKISNIIIESMTVYQEIYKELPPKLLGGKHSTSNALKSIRAVFKDIAPEGGTHHLLMQKKPEQLQEMFLNYAQEWQKEHEPPTPSFDS